jgi:hypothetical protein
MARIFSFFFLLLSSFTAFAQDDNPDTTRVDKPIKYHGSQKFQYGIMVGSYFASNTTAGMYDGYGYDVMGYKNTFENSLMNIAMKQNDGTYGGTDRIADALHVQHGEWSFDENNMPINMHYNIAFAFGINTRYKWNERDALIFNVNLTNLTASGNFTINLTTTPSNQTLGYQNFQTFAIRGKEQRLDIQLGYQRVVNPKAAVSFFYEGGWNLSLARFSKNEIQINNLIIDIASTYSNPAYGNGRPSVLTGVGFAGFLGAGMNIAIQKKYTIQLFYQPNYGKLNIGGNTDLRLQNYIGVRMYGIF